MERTRAAVIIVGIIAIVIISVAAVATGHDSALITGATSAVVGIVTAATFYYKGKKDEGVAIQRMNLARSRRQGAGDASGDGDQPPTRM